MKKINFRIKNLKRIDLLIIVLFFVSIFSFLFLTGTLNSGYHLIDDHTMLSLKSSLMNNSFWKTTFNYIKSDFSVRFRPLFGLYYISEVQIFGTNFFNLSIFTGILAFFSFSFFYTGMRKLKNTPFLSLIFVLLMFFGTQMAIWWRLGTAETIGMYFLGLSFLFMSKCLNENKYKRNNIIFVIFLILASLCKESFIIVIPAFTLFKVWNEHKAFGITLKESFKKNILSILPIIIMIIELLVIKFVVGTNKIGYAGVTSSAEEFILGVKNIIFSKSSLLYWMELLGLLICMYFVSFLFIIKKRKEEFIKSLNSLLIYGLFSLMIVLPEIFMYAKSGMVERYLLPTTLGLSFLTVGIIQNTKQWLFKSLIICAIFIFILLSFNVMKTNAVLFADSGEDANSLLSTIKNNSISTSKILLVADPVDRYEVSYSIKTYLSYYGFNNFYAYPVMREYKSNFEIGLREQWLKWFENKSLKNINNNPDLIIIFDKKQTDSFFGQSKILESNYTNIFFNSNNHSIYIKK